MAQEGRTTTLARVAASAGVSVATVSKVLNGRADVGPETRARVESLLAAHDYVARRAEVPEAEASQHTVELVFHGPLTAYTTEILQGVLEGAGERKVSVSVSVRPRSQPTPGALRPAAWARELADLGRRGVIDVVDDARHGDLPALVRAGIPLVVIDPLSPPRKELASVGTTNFSGGLAATQHLLDLGHRRVAYIGCDPSSAYNQARVHGFRAACEAAGVPVPDEYVRIGSFDFAAGVEGGGALLELPEPPTAVFAATDQIAAGVLEAARRHGARVPQDLSVVGFDDTAVAEILSPPLTTVRQPLREMGRVALVTALRVAAREPLDSHHVELATELVVRSSTAAIAAP
ncbi:transcriptional regulator, LacI family [Microlunatus sagamiharensis]|uniref:Transcriptional regulator, LacI family n=1 Tax=Microlunatus sagamiharensis TaxID=546874 RepID=A0A1H2ML00_9ACTN|nr:transcriptional regulator, LacI family [Microlunatus sagamiharensis]